MNTLDTSTYLDSVAAQTKIFADWVHGKDPETPVATTPDWNLGELVSHVGQTQRMVATLVGKKLTDPSEAFENLDNGPANPEKWRDWLTDTSTGVAEAFGSVSDKTPVWDPTGEAKGVLFWSRRLFGEITVHRADAAVVLGNLYEVAPEHAAAAVDDWLETMTSERYEKSRPEFVDAIRETGRSLHFHSTDTNDGWLVFRTKNRIEMERTTVGTDTHAGASGPAVDLMLAITRRGPVDEARNLTLHGDRAMLDNWIDHMDWVAD